jgi:hypothetical protein
MRAIRRLSRSLQMDEVIKPHEAMEKYLHKILKGNTPPETNLRAREKLQQAGERPLLKNQLALDPHGDLLIFVLGFPWTFN